MLFILQGQSMPLSSFIFPALIFIVAYFFFIRPQAKKQKSQDQFMKDLAKGDKVVTGSGIVGQISKIDEKSIQLQVDQKNFITVIPGAISKEMTDNYYSKE